MLLDGLVQEAHIAASELFFNVRTKQQPIARVPDVVNVKEVQRGPSFVGPYVGSDRGPINAPGDHAGRIIEAIKCQQVHLELAL